MWPLFLVATLCILYGTLYPFTLDHATQWSDVLPRFMDSLAQRPGRGDALSNLVLFIPFGFLGMQALAPQAPRAARLLLVCMAATVLSFGIECAQSFIVGRTTSLYDVLLNFAGALAGASLGWAEWRRRIAGLNADRAALAPLALLAAWLAYRLFPYVPTLDLQHVKDAIKPLLSDSLSWSDALRHFIVALVVGRLLQAVLPPVPAMLSMPILVLGALAAKPFLATRVLGLSETLGATTAVLAWITLLGHVRLNKGFLAGLLAIQIALQGLLPFTLNEHPSAFSFMPFAGFESGSMALNLQAFLEKMFLYGALIWLLVEARVRPLAATICVAGGLLMIEIAQRYLGRTAEITDPLLAILLGFAQFMADRHVRPRR